MKGMMSKWLGMIFCSAALSVLSMVTVFAAEPPQAPCEASDSDGDIYQCNRVGDNEVYVANTKVGDTGGMEYYLNDGNGGITSENATAENYNVSYDPAQGVLTLNGAALSRTAFSDHRVQYDTQQYPQDLSHDAVIMARRNLTIHVKGENLIENKRVAPNVTYTGLHRHGIDVFGDLVIIGDEGQPGRLTVEGSDQNGKDWADSVGINVLGGSLQLENVTLTAEGRQSTYNSTGIYVGGGDAHIINSDVTVISGAVSPLSNAVAPSWTGSYGLCVWTYGEEGGDLIIDESSSVDVRAGAGHYSVGVTVESADNVLEIKGNSVLYTTASADAAYSYGMTGSLRVDGAYVDSRSEGAKEVQYTYGGETYTDDGYSIGYSGYADDGVGTPAAYDMTVLKGIVRFYSGECTGENSMSYAYNGMIENMDYSGYTYGVAKYSRDEASEGVSEWTPESGAADTENGAVLREGYRYFEVVPEFIPQGTVEWIDDNNADSTRPDSLNITLTYRDEAASAVSVLPDENGNWTFAFGVQPVFNCQKTGDYLASDAWDAIDYGLAINDQPDKYESQINGSAYSEGGFTIIQTYSQPAVPGSKPADPDAAGEQTVSKNTRSPRTGDNMPYILAVWGALALLSAGMILRVRDEKKNSH